MPNKKLTIFAAGSCIEHIWMAIINFTTKASAYSKNGNGNSLACI